MNKEPDAATNGYDDVNVDEEAAPMIVVEEKRRVGLAESPKTHHQGGVGSSSKSSSVSKGVLEGPKPKDIINIIQSEYGHELSYPQAWESREYAVNEVRGIPEKSYGKIPKYLYMLQQANPGTYTNYEVDCDGRFKYLFISFGQSIRRFYKSIRKVIVVDGTFLKSKYKGVMLVATAVDGNSNLYPIAFGVANSEIDSSWEWFLKQLKILIADDRDLAFVSDRHSSISISLGKIYPLASHGICIHHLIGNVITFHHGRGVADMVAKASKAYRVTEFERLFKNICNISPAIGDYLQDANVEKWARYHFPGYRYDINTNNPAESINSALRTPREYPIIPLLDSIREMLTCWFYERRVKSAKQKDPLTVEVEKKISRRIEKGKTFKAYPITRNRLQVKANGVNFVVDLEQRTCSCGKFGIGKLPCRHAIRGAYAIGRCIYPYADDVYTTATWRSLYEETINPIGVPEEEWRVPEVVESAKVLPPETRRQPGRRRK
ncbi:Zinc finger SWIM-type [Arabidopsis suecica]|uniref:Zinc finger SWIM-type n=1 Tax=Arabidopsis suecica TaxID=45249 RepID=A0A8T1XRX4_ARASU|nr:Zinc finger SWIM-type [Arabidopsis suecica]